MNLNKIINELIINKKVYIYLIIALCAGVVMMLSNNGANSTEMVDVAINDNSPEDFAGQNELETKLCNILKKVEGVGEVDVFINYSTTQEKVPMRENNVQNDTVVYSTDGSKSEPYISLEIYPKIEGVVIVAQGGDNANIISKLNNTVSNILGIPLHKVSILKMK